MLKRNELNTGSPASIYLFKVNNRNTRKRGKISLKVNKKKHLNDVSDAVLVFLLLTFNILHIFF